MRIGIIGAGFIGREHIRAAKAVKDLEVVGYVDPMAKADHPGLQGLKYYDGLKELFKDKVDGVVIALPDQFHVPVAKECLENGVAVLLEKPAATSLAEALDLSRSPGVETRLQVAHQRRHHPASRVIKDAIGRGELGKLIGVGGVFALRKDDNYFVERPRGVGLVNLIHDLDLLQFYCGRITSVSASVSHAARSAKEEDTIALVMDFETGVVGSFVATDSAPSPFGWDQATKELPSIPYDEDGTTYTLLGTKASLTVPDLRLYKHGEGQAWHQPLQHDLLDAAGSNAYENQLNHFVEVMRGDVRPICGISDAVATQAALDAVFESGRQGCRISTDELVGAAR
ncbi:Gfo/Idh/MocA family oxidoreductase [Caballeronia sp. J97]|uniref:Gfo/Idh/MocA family protein n=1 Tax=Caballeronia sp. J97 TaxID=2805429 RepID=UPI002AB1BDDF|nr:Gfo/Idh/MocA family oxidoreductase [Caballeronia sp. J97]